MNRRDFLRTVGGAGLAGSLLTAGSHPTGAAGSSRPTPPQPFRKGAWAPRALIDRTPDEMRQRMAQLAEAGISLLAYFVPRAYPPWNQPDYYAGGTGVIEGYPDWDPLKVLIESAHDNGIEVHPFLCCFKPNVAVRDYLFEKYPGSEAQLSKVWPGGTKSQGSYPCAMQPRVQKFVFDMYRSITERYQPDGLFLDFIRTGHQCTCDYCTAQMAKVGIDIRALQRKYDEDEALWLATASHGLLRKHHARVIVGREQDVDPVLVDEELDQWLEWRVTQLTHFVSQMTQYAHKHGMVSSAAVKYFWPDQTSTGAQDWVRWAKEDVIDYLFLMAFSTEASHLTRVVSESVKLLAETHPKLWPVLGTHPTLWCSEPEMLAEQVKIVERMGLPGVAIHTEKFLTDAHLAFLKDL